MAYRESREARTSLEGRTMFVRDFPTRFVSICHVDVFPDADLQSAEDDESIDVVCMDIAMTQRGASSHGRNAAPIVTMARLITDGLLNSRE
jgi:hypothetical protein